MPQAKQISLIPLCSRKIRTEHGGDLSKGHRKTERPLCTKRSLHLVLRSTKAKGFRSLNSNRQIVEGIIRKASYRFHVRVYSYVLNHNHIHLSIRGTRKINIQNFLRVLAGHIAQQILRKFPLPQIRGNAPGGGTKYRRKFWNELAYSRLVAWGRDHKNVLKYIEINRLESLGLISRLKNRKKKRFAVEVLDSDPGKDFKIPRKIPG